MIRSTIFLWLLLFSAVEGFVRVSSSIPSSSSSSNRQQLIPVPHRRGQVHQTCTKNNIFYHHHQHGVVALPTTACALCGSSRSTAAWVVSSIIGGALGTPIVARATKTWYRKINLPEWTPPDRIFGPVWTTLYGLMGYSAKKVFDKVGGLQSSVAIQLALFHYALNLSWAPVFFGWKKLRAGHVINILLVSTLLMVMFLFYRIDALSGVLLAPYLAWLLFATKLSDAICKLNPTKGGYNNAMFESDLLTLQQEAANSVGLQWRD